MTEIKARRSGSFRPRRRRSRQGFTLTEIMIALGVLAVGMGMAAGAFHAGIQNHIITVDEIRRTMIGENAVAVAKARLNADVNLPPPTADGNLQWKQLCTEVNQRLGDHDTHYPIGPGARLGFFALGARAKPRPRNDFKFMVIVYEILGVGAQDVNMEVGLREVKEVIITNHSSGKSQAVVTGGLFVSVADKLPLGSLLYMSELEDPFVEVKSHIDNKTALLDRRVKAETRDLLVMTVETGQGGVGDLEVKIRGVYRGRTSLRPGQGSTDPGQGG